MNRLVEQAHDSGDLEPLGSQALSGGLEVDNERRREVLTWDAIGALKLRGISDLASEHQTQLVSKLGGASQ
jgi:hypothetical protein